MIFTDRTITVRKGESRIDEPIVVYRGDYELEVRFTILNSKFKFKSGTNMIETEKASYGQLAILTPYGGNIFSDIVRCNDGSVTFVLTADMLNQIEEVGLYSFQIRLMDYNKESRVSIPPIEFGIEVREPIASEDHDNSVNNAIVGYSIAKVVDPKEEKIGDTFDGSGNYNKTKWETGDRISEGKLNKIEDAIDKVNRNEKDNTATLSKRIDNNFNFLNAVKADKNEIFTMANMGQDVKEAMTGGSVAVVGVNTILTENIVDGQVTFDKRTHSGGNIVFYVDAPFNFDTRTRKLINKSSVEEFGLNFGNGHKRADEDYYFTELQLYYIGYIWFNPTLTGANAFIVTDGQEMPEDAENCILFGSYNFIKNYFYLNGVEFTINDKPYIDYIFKKPYKENSLTGEFAMVYSIDEPNFDTVNNKLIINATCGVETRIGHFDNVAQELPLIENGYIGYDTSNKKYVCIRENRFTPNENVVFVGYYSKNSKKYHLMGNFLIDGKKPYETYAYSKAESDNLISDSISSLKRSTVTKTNSVILYHNTLKTQENSDFDNVDNVQVTGSGFKFITNGYIVLNKDYSIEQRKTSIKFALAQDGVLSFFYKVYDGYALGGSLFTVDAQNNKMIIHEQFAEMGQIPTERVSTPFNFITGREYDLTLIKEKRKNIMIVTDMVTGETKSIETDCTAVIGDLLNEFAGGRQNGRFGIWNRQGTGNYINNLYITTKLKEPLLYITGDSICEGDRCEIGYRYSDRVENSLGKDNVAISGMSGTKITGVLNRLKSELPYIKPKYCMITIGTNGGNTMQNIQELIDYIESIGVTPILNHVSQTSGNQANDINAMLDRFSDYVGCKFDIATSLNNDIQQYYNSSLYGDGVHPNKHGHEKMFDRFKIDLPYLIY